MTVLKSESNICSPRRTYAHSRGCRGNQQTAKASNADVEPELSVFTTVHGWETDRTTYGSQFSSSSICILGIILVSATIVSHSVTWTWKLHMSLFPRSFKPHEVEPASEQWYEMLPDICIRTVKEKLHLNSRKVPHGWEFRVVDTLPTTPVKQQPI